MRNQRSLTSLKSQWNTNFTVNYLVFQDWERKTCVVCEQVGASRRRGTSECSYMKCVDRFKRQADIADKELVEIREAGDLGKGAFAKVDIPKYQLLGEYLGELVPEGLADDDTDQYYFNIAGAYTISKPPRARRPHPSVPPRVFPPAKHRWNASPPPPQPRAPRGVARTSLGREDQR